MNFPLIPDNCNLVVVLGPTACGKTRYAVQLACELSRRDAAALAGDKSGVGASAADGGCGLEAGGVGLPPFGPEVPLTAEIISADSRQVYRGMDIGTGKDLSEYDLPDGRRVTCHLLDICPAGTKYNVYEYQRDFVRVFREIQARGHRAILCGGTGLYIEAVLKAYPLVDVPENPALRERLQSKTLQELTDILSDYKQRRGDSLHNSTDTDTVRRALRAIEIEDYYETHAGELHRAVAEYPDIRPYIIGLDVDRDLRRERISRRLRDRLQQGMVDEVRALLARGIPPEDLIYYGLEYKYLTLYLTGRLGYDEMTSQLETAIHQFAKRQMTWFRGMERRGTPINWLKPDGDL